MIEDEEIEKAYEEFCRLRKIPRNFELLAFTETVSQLLVEKLKKPKNKVTNFEIVSLISGWAKMGLTVDEIHFQLKEKGIK